MEKKDIKAAVRESYARVASGQGSCCGPSTDCGGSRAASAIASAIASTIGYTQEELQLLPEGANLGLGCGNPTALASLKPGEVVLDLGSGAGIDCFLAASKVGPTGKVIGVDMTPEMLDRAREKALRGGFANVDFRLGEIENLPVADSSVDVVISNCVINLSPDKPRVFREAFRVLREGGRLAVSDIVLLRPLPEAVRESVAAYAGCLAGASLRDDYLHTIEAAGFEQVTAIEETPIPPELITDPSVQALIGQLNLDTEALNHLAHSAISLKVQALKPGSAS